MAERVVVVTGGSSGIGAAICARLLAQGATVVNIDKMAPPQPVDGCHLVLADLSDAGQTREAAAAVARDFLVTGLVNNAGAAHPDPVEAVRDAVLDADMSLHVRAALLLVQAFLPGMKRAGFGRIVNISTRAILGKKGRTVYAGTKAALVGMTRVWALELGEHGITVNAIAPGPIVTELFMRSNSPEQARRLVATTAVGRGGTPEDVAQAAAFFLDPASDFVTGQLLHVCGGASIGGAPW